jgi:DNA-binding response OmpR family regulator
MRLLVIDPDQNLVRTLVKILKKSYTVDFAFSGEDGAYLASVNTYDVITVALDLCDTDGSEFCRMIRSSNIKTPILIITKRDDVKNKVFSLDSGADDYLTKPFSTEELLARLRALNRRNPEISYTSVLIVGCLKMDLEKQIIIRGKKQISLRRKEFDILRYLMVHKGYPISKDTLLNKIWAYEDYASLNAVEVHISKIRNKINRGFKDDPIVTVKGFGYKLKG